MKKTFTTAIALYAGLFILTSSRVAVAEDRELAALKQQIKQLISQNEQLTRQNLEMTNRISTVEEAIQLNVEKENLSPDIASSSVPEQLLRTKVHQAVRKAMREEMEQAGKEQKINKHVTLFGLIEFEASMGSDFEDTSFSDFNIATGQLGFDAQVSDWAVGHMLALYEGPDDDTLRLDEANIWLGNYEKFPALLTAGKFYMPFGSYETNMIQDTLTHNLGEINDYGVAAGFKINGFTCALFGYNGMKENEKENTIKGFGTKLGYDFNKDGLALTTAVYWVNNMADADSIEDVFAVNGIDTIHDQVSGFGGNLMAGYGPIFFIGEYIQAMDEFYPGRFNPVTGKTEGAEILFRGKGAQPAAWNTELSWADNVFDKSTVVAVGYQGTDESSGLGLPESRYLGVASMVILPGTTLSIEYFHDEDYSIDEGGTGKAADTITGQFAYEF